MTDAKRSEAMAPCAIPPPRGVAPAARLRGFPVEGSLARGCLRVDPRCNLRPAEAAGALGMPENVDVRPVIPVASSYGMASMGMTGTGQVMATPPGDAGGAVPFGRRPILHRCACGRPHGRRHGPGWR